TPAARAHRQDAAVGLRQKIQRAVRLALGQSIAAVLLLYALRPRYHRADLAGAPVGVRRDAAQQRTGEGRHREGGNRGERTRQRRRSRGWSACPGQRRKTY